MATAKMMLIWCALLATWLLAACQPADDLVGDQAVVEPIMTTSTTEQPGPQIVLTEPESAMSNVDNDGRNDTGDFLRATGAIPFETALSGGRRITVTFYGGGPGAFDSPCNWDHRVDVSETAEQVGIAVTAVRILSPGAHPRDCEAAAPWAITTTLNEPIGARPLVDTSTRRTHRVIQIETRLKPTWLPDGWATELDDETLPQQNSVYTDMSDGSGAQLQLLTSPISMEPRLSSLRSGTGEPISIRRPDDGVLVIDDARRTLIGFEEQGWYYEIVSSPSVDPAQVIEFARSFERPALVDGALSAGLTTSRRVLPLQPGQDEGEARPIQGVLPTS